jgi:uncharacterized damage-inducible protein DinB
MPARTPRKAPAEPRDELREVLLETWAASEAMNQHLLKHLDAKAWRAELKGPSGDGGRTIAEMFAHMHNVRVHWLEYNAPHLKRPAMLDVRRCTMKQAAAALKKSGAACGEMLADAFVSGPGRKVTKFARGWGRKWPAGGTMFGYMFGHEAHHRGQVLLLAHQLGFRLGREEAGGIWNWDRIWKERGLSGRPR